MMVDDENGITIQKCKFYSGGNVNRELNSMWGSWNPSGTVHGMPVNGGYPNLRGHLAKTGQHPLEYFEVSHAIRSVVTDDKRYTLWWRSGPYNDGDTYCLVQAIMEIITPDEIVYIDYQITMTHEEAALLKQPRQLPD